MCMLGKRHSEEAKTKMAESKIGKRHSQERKNKISKSHVGLKHTEETKSKISEKNKGKKNGMFGRAHSEATRLKMSLATKQRHFLNRQGKN